MQHRCEFDGRRVQPVVSAHSWQHLHISPDTGGPVQPAGGPRAADAQLMAQELGAPRLPAALGPPLPRLQPPVLLLLLPLQPPPAGSALLMAVQLFGVLIATDWRCLWAGCLLLSVGLPPEDAAAVAKVAAG